METETQDIAYEALLSKFKYGRSLYDFNGELTESTLEWMYKNKIKTLGELLKRGHNGFARLMNCGKKRLEDIKNLVKNNTKLEYDFYMRSVVLTKEEVEKIQSKNYLDLELRHLNLQVEARNFLEKRDISTLKGARELGVFKIRTAKGLYESRKEKVEEALIKLFYKLSQEDGAYFVRDQ